MSDARRIQLQPAYVLHHRPYRDTSKIIELFTRDHGRVSVFARGARGNGSSSLISVLQPFNRLLVSWSGRGEAGQLTGAEFDGAMLPLPPDRLVHGFYLNELLLKLFARHDSHPDVFALYSQTLDQLKREDAVRPLRLFEKRLLEAIGYGLALERDAHDDLPIQPDAAYHYRLEQGPVRVHAVMENNTVVYSGSSLLSLAREELSDAAVCADARRLLRAALDRCLDGRELRTRQVMLALRKGK